MRAYEKRKGTRYSWKQLAKSGYINRPDGSWVSRGAAPDNSMRRDFYPQEGKK